MNLRTIEQSKFKMIGSDSPLKKSSLVTAIIHGTDIHPTNHYYVDQLQRFRRDYATVDRQDRQRRRSKYEQTMSQKRMQTIHRQLSLKKLQDDNLQKLRNRQTNSQHLHNLGTKLTIHSHGIPIDPVNLQYQNTIKGRYQRQLDNQKKINNLVRAHHLQTCGTSGFNIINGQPNVMVEQMVSKDNYPKFENKLNQFYEQFRLRPSP